MASPLEYAGVVRPPVAPDYSGPLLNFSWAGQLPQDYWAGEQIARARAMQGALREGIPRDPQTGQYDYGKLLDTYGRLAGAEAIPQLLPLAMRQQALAQNNQGGVSGVGGSTSVTPSTTQSGVGGDLPQVSVPAINTAPNSATGPANIRAGQSRVPPSGEVVPPNAPARSAEVYPQPRLSSAGTDNQGADTVRTLASEVFGERDVSQLIPRFASAFKVDPDAPLTPAQVAQIRPRMAGTLRYVTNAPPAAQAMPGADLVPRQWLNAGRTPQEFADHAFQLARNYELSGFPEAGKTWQARGQAVLDAIGKAAEIPTEVKLAQREGMSVPEYQGVVKSQEAVGGAVGKRVGEVVEAGGQAARHTINTLSIMQDAINRAGGNFSTGPGAEQMLRLKQAAQNWLPGTGEWKGLKEAETIKKLNAVLASQAAKAMTARPSQLEFRAFMQNNPGLGTSVAGTKVLINIMRQAAEQDIALGRLAMDPRNLRNWAAVEEGFYRNHPIESPFAVQPPESAIAHLKTNPGTAKQFDEMFGLGSAAKVLGAR